MEFQSIQLKITGKTGGVTGKYEPVQNCGIHVWMKDRKQLELAEQRTLCLKNDSDSVFEGVIHFELEFTGLEPRFFLPAFLYGRNRGEAEEYVGWSGMTAQFPRLSLERKTTGYSDYWKVRGDRLSHPVSMALCENCLYGISMKPFWEEKNCFNGFSVQMRKNGGSVGVTLGYENTPGLYVCGCDMREPTQGTIKLQPGEECFVNLYLYQLEAPLDTTINTVIRDVYRRFHQAPRSGASVKECVRDITGAIYRDAFVPEIPTYSTRVFLNNGEKEQEPLGSISWTGGVEVAGPQLMAAARLKDQDMRHQALKVIQAVVDHSMNEKSGLPYDACDEKGWYTEGWWDPCLSVPGHTSYVVGQALYYILKSYETEREYFETLHPEWLGFAKRVLDHIDTTLNEEGEVPYIWSAKDGCGVEYDSFAGCWCVTAAVLYDMLSGGDTFLESSIRSLKHYYEAYVKRMECYGTPMDTYKAVDSEGSLAFAKACRLLHERTGERIYLEMLKDGLEYEFTFKFCWNPPIQVPPLGRMGWSCCGGSVTSTCNPHIHPMSNNVCDEIAYCADQTGDEYYRQRLSDTVGWALQTYSRYDGEYDYGLKGWMSERFCYSEGLLTELYEDGSVCSTWKCFLPWGASNIVEGLCGKIWKDADFSGD
ncbi:MAG: hypothetical protein PUJ62_03770 [Lachnospiraceae bacterium]|nr:hypothetical protein [Lachnospiraceae bacterium]